MERAEQPMGSGILATLMTMAITYSFGSLLDFTGWLAQAWAHVTVGQATILIGLLTYATHNGPKLARWVAAKVRRAEG